MRVLKRNGQYEAISFDKILERINALNKDPTIQCDKIAQEVIKGLVDGISTSKLDDQAAYIADSLSFKMPQYGKLAARIYMSNHHKDVIYRLADHFDMADADVKKMLYKLVADALYTNIGPDGRQSPIIAPDLYALINVYWADISAAMDYEYDCTNYTYHAARMLVTGNYLLRCNLRNADGKPIGLTPIEYVQHSHMRYALSIHFCNHAATDWETLMPDYTCKCAKLDDRVDDEWGNCNDYDEVIPDYLKESLSKTICNCYWEQLISSDIIKVPTRTEFDAKWPEVLNTYCLLRDGKFAPATPTRYNIGTLRPQCASCFLMDMPEDSLDGIIKYWGDAAKISKYAGGIGSSTSNIRSTGSYIAGTNGNSNGLVPLMRVVNEIASYIDQGGGKREGAHAVYLEPWHADFMDFIMLKLNTGNERLRARALLYGLWINDEFMRTASTPGAKWYFIDPKIAPDLRYAYDKMPSHKWISDEELLAKRNDFAFTFRYRRYIRAGKYTAYMLASDVLMKIYHIIMETGGPYMCFKDAVNRKTNQSNLGTIMCSNLCTEIMEFSSPTETPVCTLSSIVLPAFVVPVDQSVITTSSESRTATARNVPTSLRPTYYQTSLLRIMGRNGPDGHLAASKMMKFDWTAFEDVVRQVVRNLNIMIDINFYPIPETELSNKRHRPIDIGVLGLADLYSMLRLPFNSTAASQLGFYIFECLYYTAVHESATLASLHGPYSSYQGSPASKGLLQPDLWIKERMESHLNEPAIKYKLHYNWAALKEYIVKCGGLRNSLLVGPMPTASVSTIQGVSPSIEPHNALVYKRKNKYGDSTVVNAQFAADMIELGYWNENLRNYLRDDRHGSISGYQVLPSIVRDIYRTAYDIDMQDLIDMNLTRSPFVDQSTSFNWFIDTPTPKELNTLHFYNWRRGIKTSCYYMRRLPPADAQKVQRENTSQKNTMTYNTPVKDILSAKYNFIETKNKSDDADKEISNGYGGICVIENGKKSCCE